MSKRKRRQKKRNGQHAWVWPAPWLDEEGLHALLPGFGPSKATLDEMNRIYQKNIRNSPIWNEMVKQFGEEEAERLLLQFRVEVK
jgi:hypothetical protein